MSGQAFAIDIARWCAKANKKVEAASRAIVFELFTRVVLKTPVDTGRARANWQVGFNQPPAGTTDATDPSGTQWQNGFTGQVVGNVTYLVNNLPYIGMLEFGGYGKPPGSANGPKTIMGYSRQAPAGMVRVSVREIVDIVHTATKDI